MILLISLVLLLICCAGYAGWYFGRLDGLSFRHSEEPLPPISFSTKKSTPNPTILKQDKSVQTHPSFKKGQATISWQALNKKAKKKTYDFSNTPQYKYSNNALAENTLKKLNRQIENVQRRTRNIDAINDNERRISESRLPKNKLMKEKSPVCRWTLGRIGELKRIINTGGKGSKSQFCREYDKRVFEMRKYACLNRRSANFGGVC